MNCHILLSCFFIMFLSCQVTTQRDKAKQEQDDVLGKLSLLEIERGKLIDESTTTERKLKETTKVFRMSCTYIL